MIWPEDLFSSCLKTKLRFELLPWQWRLTINLCLSLKLPSARLLGETCSILIILGSVLNTPTHSMISSFQCCLCQGLPGLQEDFIIHIHSYCKKHWLNQIQDFIFSESGMVLTEKKNVLKCISCNFVLFYLRFSYLFLLLNFVYFTLHPCHWVTARISM